MRRCLGPLVPDDSRRNQLLAAIRSNRNEPEPYHVYADLLSDEGDPHGAFIARQLRHDGPIDGVDLAPADRDWLAKHAPAILGRFSWWTDHQFDALGRAITWRWGFFDTIVISGRFRPLGPVVEAALRAPAAAALRRLELRNDWRRRGDPSLVAAVAQSGTSASGPPLEELLLIEAPDPRDPGWEALLSQAERPLHTLVIGMSRWVETTNGELVTQLARSALLPGLRRLRLPGRFEEPGPFWQALIEHAEAFTHLESLELDPPPRSRSSVPRELRAMGNVRWSDRPALWRLATVRDHRSFVPPIHCPQCVSELSRACLDYNRLICTVCGTSFEAPSDRGAGHPGPPEDLVSRS